MAGKKRSQASGRRSELERKRAALDKRGAAPSALQFNRLSSQFSKAQELIERCSYSEAEELLDQLDNGNRPAVLELKVFLFQAIGDHESCSRAAQRLIHLEPDDPNAILMYAQESMYCGRVTIAQKYYRAFLRRFREHPNAVRAANAIEILAPEFENRIKSFGFPIEDAEELLVLHEESVGALHHGDFSLCAAKCKELLVRVPSFISARNNLAVAYFQSGSMHSAIDVVEETVSLTPTNSFAKVILAKLYFLSGRCDDAYRIADQIKLNPPTDQDALIACLEMLSIIGRDADLLQLAESKSEAVEFDKQRDGIRYHFLAYAKYRMGNEKAAKADWAKSVHLFPGFLEAKENLSDLKSKKGNIPWAVGFGKWLPPETANRLVKAFSSDGKKALSGFPEVASMIPALLDRGDPVGRELALRLAMADASPNSIEALRAFSFGSRGPDEMRFEAINFLSERGFLEWEQVRFFSQGKWTEVLLSRAEIFDEPEETNDSPLVNQLIVEGTEAMYQNDAERARCLFECAVAESPDNCCAVHNLCVIWMQQDGASGMSRAKHRIEQLHREFPDYEFATITLAQFAIIERNFQKARDLLAIAFQVRRMHLSQAIALHTAQIHLSIETKDMQSAERTYEILCRLADKNHPTVLKAKEMLDHAKSRRIALPWRK